MAFVHEVPQGKINGTVLLLHGKNFSLSYWQSTIEMLVKKGYAVVAPDQVGFGGSSKPGNYQFSFQQLAANTRLLLDSLGITQVTMLGHSMGGMLAVRMALMYPGLCNKVILENPIGLEDWKTKVPYTTVDNEYEKELKKTRNELKAYMEKNYFHNTWKAAYEQLLDESMKISEKQDHHNYAMDMALTSDMIFTQPVIYEFGNLKMPVIFIIGQLDKTAIGKDKADAKTAGELGNYPELGKKAAAAVQNGRLMPLDGLGHIPHIENFARFSEALEKALTD